MMKRAKRFEDFLMAHDFVVKNPYNGKTFKNVNGSSVIDLIIVKQSFGEQIKNIKIDDTTLTQHSLISFQITAANFEKNCENTIR
jgi:hypothetical protein